MKYYRPSLGSIISRTKCDRDKHISILEKEGISRMKLGIK